MEWIIGIYIAIGLFKIFGLLFADITKKPMWMYTEKNPLVWALFFVACVIAWPLAKG